jgi:hypothetical protein
MKENISPPHVLLPDLPCATPLPEVVLFAFDDRAFPFRNGAQVHLRVGRQPHIVLPCGSPGSHDERVLYYGTTIKIGDTFHMWYNGNSGPAINQVGPTRKNFRICYATSRDGERWEKPELGLTEFNGSKRNNIVAFPKYDTLWSTCAILHDPEERDPKRRFKMMFECVSDEYVKRYGNRQHWGVAFSSDGLRWTLGKPFPIGGFFEMCGITKLRGLYYVNGQGDFGAHSQRGARRLCTHVSSDFEHWSPINAMGFDRASDLVGPSREADGTQEEEVHLGAGLWNRAGHRLDVVMDLGLVVSHDAIHFHEPIKDFRIIPAREQPGMAIGVAPALMQGQGMENHRDRTLYWYSHWRALEGEGVLMAHWERDRLGYIQPHWPHGRPQVITCPIEVKHSTARVYVNASGLGKHAHLEIELLDKGFRAVPGYSGADAAAVQTNSFRMPVRWKRGAVLKPSHDRVRLSIRFAGVRREDACLHAVYVAK